MIVIGSAKFQGGGATVRDSVCICIGLFILVSFAAVAQGVEGLAAAWLFDEGSGGKIKSSSRLGY